MKRVPSDLAILGGTPEFPIQLHVGQPNIGNRRKLHERLDDILDRRWLTNNGVYVQELERRVAALTRAKHCVAVCNGTTALEIAIRALELRGEVVVPSFTFVATAHALQWQQIAPVFCDIDPETHTLAPRRVAECITQRTTGIVATHTWGRLADVDELSRIARARGLRLLFDAAHAFACSRDGTMVGNFGDGEILSFHATKFFNTFEGGAIVTNNDELAGRARLMRNFGFAGYDNVVDIGINGKMCEVAAAMGLTSLEDLDSFIAINRRNYDAYRREIEGVPGCRMLRHGDAGRSNYQYVVVEIDAAAAGLTRDVLTQVLHAENVIARRYFYPGCHRMEPYRTLYPGAGSRLPETESLAQRVLVLPTGTAVSEESVAGVCHVIKFSLAHAGTIRAAVDPTGLGCVAPATTPPRRMLS